MKSLYSVAHGNWFGTGLGKGTFETTGGHQLIPYLNTDFIYSALAQELGLVGVAALLLVYMLFVARGFKIAMLADDGFSKLLAVGLTFAFALQTFIIVGGILRIIPLTGITLPFVSYGGSSVVANFVLLGGPPARLQPRQRGARMNRQIARLALVGLGLVAALIVATTYWQTWATAGLADRQDNEIQRVAQFSIKRGLIRAADGTILATNRKKRRRRPDALLPPLPAARALRAHRRLLDPVALPLRARGLGERLPDRLEREPPHRPRTPRSTGSAARRSRATTSG